ANSNGAAQPAALTLSGLVTLGTTTTTITVNSAPTVVNAITGQITGSGTLTKMGNGLLQLAADNTSTLTLTGAGGINIQAGTLQILTDTALGAAPGLPVSYIIVLYSSRGGVPRASGPFNP